MPELPEVETIKRQLEPLLVGQTIKAIEILKDKSFQGNLNDVLGQKIVSVNRKGKMLIFATGHKLHATSYILIHLKMTGQLIYEPSAKVRTDNPARIATQSVAGGRELTTENRIVGGHPTNSWMNQLPDKHTRVILRLDKGTLFFNDQRVFGWVKIVDELRVNELMRKMPPDIIDSEVTPEFFYAILQSSGRPIKIVIMDSSKLGGVGNIYANDGLFLAGIDPRRPAKSLSHDENDRVLVALQQVINLGIKLGGATAGDGKFMHTTGVGGSYQDHFLVYEQESKVIERDGKKGVVKKFKLGGRGTYWIPELQK